MSYEVSALTTLPFIPVEERIRYLRRCPATACPMVKTLDERTAQQRRLVKKILLKYKLSVRDLLNLSRTEINKHDVELQLCYNILLDCDYIDSLR